MRRLYPDVDAAIAYLQSNGASYDKQSHDLLIRGPLGLRTLGALDYIRKSRIVCFTKDKSGKVGATVSSRSFTPRTSQEAA